MKKKVTPCSTVKEAAQRAQALRHRALVLRHLLQELELRFGRLAGGDPELLAVDGDFERPRRDVVDQIRAELLKAQFAAHRAYTGWVGNKIGVALSDADP